MTDAQKEELKAMTVEERVRKYLPLLMAKPPKITKEQYDWVLQYGREIPVTTEALIGAFGGHEVPVEPPKGPDAPSNPSTPSPAPTGGQKTSQKQRLLNLLSDYKPHTTLEIMEKVYGVDKKGYCNIHGRISELREDGYNIINERVEGAVTQYVLLNHL
jgi:hypothetical protein